MPTSTAELIVLLIQATVLLAASALLVRGLIWLLRPASPTVQRIAWLLVLVQGIVLVRLPIHVPWYEPGPVMAPVAGPAEVSPMPPPTDLIGPVLEPAIKPAEVSPTRVAASERPDRVREAVASRPEPPVAEPALAPTPWNGPQVLLVVWVAGMLLVPAYGMFKYLRFLRRIRGIDSGDEAWTAQWRRLQAARGVRPIPLRATRDAGPALCLLPSGYAVLVPADVWRGLSFSQREGVLRHELAHYERGDLWKSLLVRLVALPHWFNPLAWWAVRKFDECTEWLCDDAAVANRSNGHDFAQALVQLGTLSSPHASALNAARGRLFHRIRRLVAAQPLEDSKMKKSLLLIATSLLLLLGAFRLQLVAKERAEAAPAAGATAGTPANPPAVVPPETTKTVALSGVVVDPEGRAEAGVSVRAITHDDHEPVAESDAQGRFQLRVDRGRLRGLVILGRTADMARQGFFEVDWNPEPGKGLPPVRLVLSPARSIDVLVVDRMGKPVPDAVVGAVGAYEGLDTGRSDQQGKFTLHVPAEVPLQDVYASKSGLGLDYVSIPKPERATTGDQPQPPDLSRPLTLKLTGARTVRIKLTGPEGRPIEGIRVSPWYFQKPEWGRLDNLNISGVKDFQKKTDAAGVAIFDWIPAWNKQSIFFLPGDRDLWARTRITWNPEKDPPEIAAELQRTVPVRGQVRHADGSPGAGILIEADGRGRSLDGFFGRTWTDDKGRFEIRVNPDLVYAFTVGDAHWAAPGRAGIAVRPDTPVDGIDFQLLQTATRLRGQLTLESENKLWAGQTVTLIQRGPDPTSGGRGILRHAQATTDAEGQYVFNVGPGQYRIEAADSSAGQTLTVTDQKELVCNLHIPHKQRGMITVRVVDQGDPPRPVPSAHVVGVCVSSMSHANLEATTNDQGWFRVERWLDKMIVYARSKDNKLAGSLTITAGDAEVTVRLQPVGAVKGQVIDQATGLWAADRRIRGDASYRYELPNNAAMSSTYLSGGARTDAEGRFEITGLVPGLEYQLSAALFKDTDRVGRDRNDPLAKVTVKGGEAVDLGIVKFRRDMTPGELLDAVLANRDPLDKRLKEMADEGQERAQRVLILFWTDESRQHLAEIIHNFAGYRVLSSRVDPKQMKDATAAYAAKWKLESFDAAWPLFCILDGDGRPLVVKDTRDFAKEGKVDDSRVREFLQKHSLKESPARKRPG